MIVIVMGVSGSGKTSVGRLLAERLGWAFYDADDFHPAGNIEKMRHGVPLTDADRADWLTALAELLSQCLATGQSSVLACSALKHSYRRQLHIDPHCIQFVYLKGEYAIIWERMQQRKDHYMAPAMLASQLAILEEPDDAITMDIAQPVEQIVAELVARFSGPSAQ
jgi:gluconokinase